jgi:hypothetical protein
MKDLYQVMPPLTEDEYASLREDIMIRGVLVPVEKDEAGNILDGHHRVRICEELGIKDYPVTIRPGLTEADKRNHARAINCLRRHLDAAKRAPHIAQLRSEGWSFRRIAEAVGVNEKTVRNDLKATADYSAVETPARTIGKDGKSRPATMPARGMPSPVFATSDREAQKVISLAAANPSLLDGLGEGINFSASDVAKADKQEKLAAIKDSHQRLGKTGEGTATAYKKDALEFLASLPEKSADLLFTDPPYSTDVDDIREFADSWLALALSRVKDTGRAYVCVGAYPAELQAYLNSDHGHMNLAQILVWTYRNTLGPTPSHLYKQNWQAILYFTGPDCPPLDSPVMIEQFSVQDISAPDGRIGNRYHAWQKPDELAERIVRHSTKEGDFVIDPFCCTGTFIAAAARLGRHAQGCDIDTDALEIAFNRGVVVII